MGISVTATSALAYGIAIKLPHNPCWPLYLKLLKKVANDGSLASMAARAIPAESLKNDKGGDGNDSTQLPEPIAKYSKRETRILVSCDEAKPWGKFDSIFPVNFLEIPKAANEAFDRVLGAGHGLVMKAYYGHGEGAENAELLLQVEENGFGSGPVDSCQGVSLTEIDALLVNKEETDALIKKALDVFGLEVDDGQKPGWIMATECCFYG